VANPLDQVASWPATAAAGVASAAGLLESARPAERPYRWASVTKLLVALAALDAVQRGLREPQPGLAQLATLVDSVRSTGLPVTLHRMLRSSSQAVPERLRQSANAASIC
jgi:CubicO group peptidase (beta-lactamase class C family)